LKINQTNLYFSAGSQFVSALTIPILSREFMPDEYGLWILKVVAALSIGFIINLRMDRAIAICETLEEAFSVMILGFMTSILILIICLPINLLLKSPQKSVFFEICILAILASISYSALALSNRALQIKVGIISQLFSSSGSLLIAVLIHRITNSELSFIFGYFFGMSASIALCIVFFLKKRIDLSRVFTTQTFKYQIQLLKIYKRFPLYFTPITFISLVRDRTIYIILTISGSFDLVGAYNIAMRIVSMPNNIFSGVMRPRITDQINRFGSDPQKIREIIVRLSLYVTTLMSTFTAILICLGEFLVTRILGANWLGTTAVLSITSIVGLSQILVGWLDRVVDQKLEHKYALKLEGITFSLSCLVLAQSIMWNVNPSILILETSILISGYNLALLSKVLVVFEISRFRLRLFLYFLGAFSLQVMILRLVTNQVSPLFSLVLGVLLLISVSLKNEWQWLSRRLTQ
jgi:O-antigen/teichoic acid export membrane protein